MTSTYSQTQQHVLANTDLYVQAKQSVHAPQLQFVHQLHVQFVFHERKQVGDGRRVYLPLGFLFQAAQSTRPQTQQLAVLFFDTDVDKRWDRRLVQRVLPGLNEAALPCHSCFWGQVNRCEQHIRNLEGKTQQIQDEVALVRCEED